MHSFGGPIVGGPSTVWNTRLCSSQNVTIVASGNPACSIREQLQTNENSSIHPLKILPYHCCCLKKSPWTEEYNLECIWLWSKYAALDTHISLINSNTIFDVNFSSCSTCDDEQILKNILLKVFIQIATVIKTNTPPLCAYTQVGFLWINQIMIFDIRFSNKDVPNKPTVLIWNIQEEVLVDVLRMIKPVENITENTRCFCSIIAIYSGISVFFNPVETGYAVSVFWK